MTGARATYRLQLRREFTFEDAAGIIDYLARLGVTDLYTSPILQARPGSTHGYDIVDHGRLSDELGGDRGFAVLEARLRGAGMGYIVDIVPNHMGVTGADNAAWLDVLEWGPHAARAAWFDIDWDPESPYLRGKLLVPVLGEQYGAALEGGKLALRFDAEDGAFAVWAYGSHKLPICPLHYGEVLRNCAPPLARLGERFAHISVPLETSSQKLKTALKDLARDGELRADLEKAVSGFNGREGATASWERLHALIGRQYWRVAYFKAAADDINYRRFFNVNELAGIRMELDEVFEQTHAVIFSLVARGAISGLRIDHIDGLLDPQAYLEHVRQKLPGGAPLVVEKILAQHETLRPEWPVDGTTGYEFANLVLGLLIDPIGERPLAEFYETFTADRQSFGGTARESKHRIMENELASELHMLARHVASVAAGNPRTADYTRNLLCRALKEVLACFPVYRTYLDEDRPASEADRRDVTWAISVARKGAAVLDPTVFDFLERLFLGELDGVSRYAALRCAMKVQQYSGPVMAKALEDTAFYRNTRYLALNEVGGNPEQFFVTPAAFHKANAQRIEHWPRSLLATSTHDTKRGEDARARLAVLSEISGDWARHVALWSRVLRARRADVEGQGPPDRRDEYAFYQLLVATWPVELLDEWGGPLHANYVERISAAMIKGAREAKIHTSWGQPNEAYEDALKVFVRDALDPGQGAGFRESFLPFTAQVARWGAHNTLAQTVLKLTVPGVPDIYQGCELWDLSMVDPDNRRPVDYASRRKALEDIATHKVTPAAAMTDWRSGAFKLALIFRLLRLRREEPALFAGGTYEPLVVAGEEGERVVAFLRRSGAAMLLVLMGRFPARGPFEDVRFSLELPDGIPSGGWIDLLSDEDASLPTGLGKLGMRVLSRSP